jgi:pilus assembly protein Flp/PilA
MNNIISLLQDEGGATAIEYGLIAGLIAVAIILAVTLTGTNLSDGFTGVSDDVSSSMPT